MSQQMSYSFPILSDKEVGQCLNELGMSATLEQLAKPTFEFVQPIYENLVTALLGVTREELQQPVFLAIDALEFPELHDESIPALAFIKHLNKLLLASGIKDFSLRDLYKPEAPRLRRNLSAIINFAKFREEKLAAYTELQEAHEALLAGRDQAASRHAALTAELDALRAEREAQQPEVARLEAESEALRSENQSLNKQQAALSSEVRSIKSAANALTDEAAKLRFETSEAHAAVELLRSQVVHSPQRVAAMLEEISAALERERRAVAEAERRARELHARADAINKAEKEVAKAVGLMEALEAEIGRKKETSRKVKELRSAISAQEHEVAQLTATNTHLRRQQQSLAERIERLEAQCKTKREAAELSIEERLRDREAILAEQAAAAARIAQNEAAMRSLRERITELRAAHDAQIGGVLERYDALCRQVDAYHAALEAAMAGGDTAGGSGGSAQQAAALPLARAPLVR